MRTATYTLGLVLLLAGAPTHAQDNWRVDSLLATWPVRAHGASENAPLYQGVVRMPATDALLADLRGRFPDLPVFADTAVTAWVQTYAGPRREELRVLFGMARHLLPRMREAMRRSGAPEGLAYLPMALSAMNPLCGSASGEAGLWMLDMPHALREGLAMDGTRDERHDPDASTDAALRIWHRHMARYQDTGLAALALATGPANVARALSRTGGKAPLAALYPAVDEAQRDLMPLWMAFLYLSMHEEDLDLGTHDIRVAVPVDTLTLDTPVALAVLEEALDLPRGMLRWLNPVWCGGRVTSGARLNIPSGRREEALAWRGSLQEGRVREATTGTTRYTVRSGDSLGAIAARFGVSVGQIRSWNGLTGDRIVPGQHLEIRGTAGNALMDVPTSSPDTPGSFEWYTVRSGDSLYMIAKRFPGISADRIMQYNQIGADIRPGQRIKIPTTP